VAKLNVGVPLLDNIAQGALELQYMSKRRTLAGDFADGHVVTNLNFLTRVFRPVEVVASVYNLLDVDYGDPGAEEHTQDILRRDGRTFRLAMTYRDRPLTPGSRTPGRENKRGEPFAPGSGLAALSFCLARG
jgi:hypothetical protein